VAGLRRRKMAAAPAHGTHRAHAVVIDSSTLPHNNRPTAKAVVPPGRSRRTDIPKKARARGKQHT
jgi:hypothetical protein